MKPNRIKLQRNVARTEAAAPDDSGGMSRRDFVAKVQNSPTREISYVVNNLPINVWLPVRLAAYKIGRSEDTVERRGIPWQREPVKFRLRYKYFILDEGADAIRGYLERDLEALLVEPDERPANSRPRFIPRFVDPKLRDRQRPQRPGTPS